MKKIALLMLVACAGIISVAMPAQARDHFSVGIGLGGWGYPGYYPYYGYPAYYPYYPPAYYEAPPTVVYAQPAPQPYYVQQPQPAPQYQAMPPQQMQQPMPQPQVQGDSLPPPQAAPEQQVLTSTQTSNTFTDSKGRSCRMFSSTLDGAPVNGTACQQPDGSWRTSE